MTPKELARRAIEASRPLTPEAIAAFFERWPAYNTDAFYIVVWPEQAVQTDEDKRLLQRVIDPDRVIVNIVYDSAHELPEV